MSAIEDLAATDGLPPDAISAAEQIDAICDLETYGWKTIGGRFVGKGGSATGDWYLRHGSGAEESIYFERVRDMAKPGVLRAELAAAIGATPKLTGDQALQVLASFRALAEVERAFDADEIARGWGVDYLQIAPVLDLDVSDQKQRWGAFQSLEGVDPVALRMSGEVSSVAAGGPVLRHEDGRRYVRTGWFRGHVRAEESCSSTEVATRMMRVGWERRGASGRIKASHPDFDRVLAWAFYEVPAGWEQSE